MAVGLHVEIEDPKFTRAAFELLIANKDNTKRHITLIAIRLAERMLRGFGPDSAFLALSDGSLVRASKTGTFSGTGTDGDTITVGGQVFTLKDTPAASTHIQIGATAAATRNNAVTTLNAASQFVYATASSTASIVLSSKVLGVIGNLITLAESGKGFSFAGGATALSGGSGFFVYPVLSED